MRFALSLGAAIAALTLAASAHTEHQRIFIRHAGAPGGDLNIDADNDGWVTRAEASAAADRVFDELDTNNDGQLDQRDHAALNGFNIRFDVPDIHVDVPEIHLLEGGDDEADADADDDDDNARGVVVLQDDQGHRTVRIIRRGEHLDAATRAEIERAVQQAQRAAEQAERVAEQAQRQADAAQRDADRASEEAERQAEQAERQAERAQREAERMAERAERDAERATERAERDAERASEDAERHVERNVVIVRGHGGAWASADGVIAPIPPVPPVPAVPPAPMFMMLIANSDEADLNGDGALSREEFRAQHLRFFDASDANGDGRIRFEEPPIPPTPPTAAAPAAPPAPAAPTAPPAPPAPPRHR